MLQPIKTLLDSLSLTPTGKDRFLGRTYDPNWTRIFGGQVLGQSLIAAEMTIENMAPHSLHGYFMLGGDPNADLIFEVERLRNGRSFATRSVKAIQHDRAIFTMLASFHRPEEGPSHQARMPAVRPPDELPQFQGGKHKILEGQSEAVKRFWARERPFDLRPTDPEVYLARQGGEKELAFWFRTREPLADEPALHHAALAFLSDMIPIDSILLEHQLSVFDPRIQVASLDHSMWFHRAFRVDEWMLFVVDRTSAGKGRGLSQGSIFRQDGELVASVAQEGLIRPTDRNRLKT